MDHMGNRMVPQNSNGSKDAFYNKYQPGQMPNMKMKDEPLLIKNLVRTNQGNWADMNMQPQG